MNQSFLYLLLATDKGLISDVQYEIICAIPEGERIERLRSLLNDDQFEAIESEIKSGSGADANASASTLGPVGETEVVPGSRHSVVSVAPGETIDTDVTREESGRYNVIKEQGRGAIGRVMLAFDEHIGRNVAIKELLFETEAAYGGSDYRSNLTNARVGRFLREARITGQLQHPSIIPVHEIGKRDDGTFYYTMKLIKGQTLSQAIKEAEGIEQRTKFLPHFRDMCHAIAFAHSFGVVHRDIKPANVMIGQFGETVVLDWGLAKVHGEPDERVHDLEEGMRLLEDTVQGKTVDGSTMGTPAYMPPEQARGEIGAVDAQSDVYSLGACLYEILAGHTPYLGKSPFEIIKKVISEPMIPLENEKDPPPAELVAIATKALSKEKQNRYCSARELAGDVEAYLSGKKVTVYEYSSIELLKRFASKNKIALVASMFVLFALVFSLISNSMSLSKEMASNEQMKAAVRLEKDAKRKAYFHMAQAFGREAGLLEKKNRLLGTKIYAAASLLHNPSNRKSPYFHPEFAKQHPLSLKVRAEAATRLYEAGHRDTFELEGMIPTAEANIGSAVSPNGQLVAVGGADKKITLWDTTTKQQVCELVGHKDLVYTVAFSPDGGTVFSGSQDGTVRAFDIQSRKQLWRFDFPYRLVYNVEVSADGKWVAAVGSGKDIQLLDRKTGTLVREIRGHQERVHGLSFSPDGKTLASGGYDLTVRLWEVETGNPVATMEGHQKPVWCLSFSHDGRHLASGSNEGTIRIWDVKSRTTQKVLEGHGERTHGVHGVDYSPDDTRLLSAASDRKVRLWDTETGENVATVQAHKDGVHGAHFLGAGNRLVSVSLDKTLKIWTIAEASPIVALEGHTQMVWSVKYSGDGKRLVSASMDGTVRVWDAESHGLLGELGDHDGTVQDAEFSPDGNLIASGGADKRVRIWDAETFEKLFELDGHDGSVLALVFSRDGTRLATGGVDTTIRLWDLLSRKEVQVFEGHPERVYSLLFTKGDSRLVSVSADSTIRLWDVGSGAELRRIDTPDWITGLDATEDEKWLFTSGKDQRIVMWELPTLKKAREFVGHEQWVNFITVSPDGRTLASSSDDNTVRLWSVSTAEPLLIWSGTQSIDLDFSPDGRTLAVSDGNNIKLFPVDLSGVNKDPEKLLEGFERFSGLTLEGFVLENMKPSDFARISATQ